MFQPKHVRGYTDYNTINLHNCICICWLLHMRDTNYQFFKWMKSTTTIKIMISGVITTCSIKSLFQHFWGMCWGQSPGQMNLVQGNEEVTTENGQSLQPFHTINTFPPPNHLHIHLKGTVTLKMESASFFETSKHIYYPKQCKNLETIISPLQTGIHTVNFINDKMSNGKGLAS